MCGLLNLPPAKEKRLTCGLSHSKGLGGSWLKKMDVSTASNSGSSNMMPSPRHVSRIWSRLWFSWEANGFLLELGWGLPLMEGPWRRERLLPLFMLFHSSWMLLKSSANSENLLKKSMLNSSVRVHGYTVFNKCGMSLYAKWARTRNNPLDSELCEKII